MFKKFYLVYFSQVSLLNLHFPFPLCGNFKSMGGVLLMDAKKHFEKFSLINS